MSSEIKVSVCVVTYNQEKYIEQCVRSVLEQKTQYEYEVIIGDDASTDNTRNILMDLEAQYPDKIRLLLHDKNIGPSDNVLSVYKAARGQYIAHLDGDDYFLPGKIEKQVGLMDADPNCGMSFHSVLKLEPTGTKTFEKINCKGMPVGGWTLKDLLWLMAIGVNSSKMFRRELLERFQDPGFPLVDTVFNVLILGNAKVKVINDAALGVYRNAVGISSSCLGTRVATIKGYDYLLSILPKENRVVICSVTFFLMLLDIKNFRGTCYLNFRLWLKSFDSGFLVFLWRNGFFIR
ncbi:glycosyltransferase family 2 protein [Aeromonas salmonicida]|uniref:glycosyltransferase family 2 protein n=1 Tax=Aeromonas salmonicida TaxID=645 RepID=UPI00223F510C|nr:glycosyltransferase family 2 protein [Aeromonas salmonicida]MDF8327490.1 glycosyltransferase family 2 protein [Aeromonas salmonicida]